MNSGIFYEVFTDGNMTMPRALILSLIGFLVVFLILGIIAAFVKIMGAILSKTGTKAAATETVPTAPAIKGTPLPDTTSQGTLDLINVSEKEAAVIMAIVSNKSGIPLNRLKFNSIKLISEDK